MLYFLIPLLALIAYMAYRHKHRRHKTPEIAMARSAEFLKLLEAGASAEEADERVLQLFAEKSDPAKNKAALARVVELTATDKYEGERLLILKEARAKGFTF